MNDHMDKRPDDKRPNRNNPGNQGPNKNRQTILGFLICLLISLVCLSFVTDMMSDKSSEITYDKFIEMVDKDQIKEVTLQSGVLTVVPKLQKSYQKESYKVNQMEDTSALTQRLEGKGIIFKYEQPDVMGEFVSTMISLLLPTVVLFFMLMYLMRRMNKGSGGGIMGVGKSRAKAYIQKETGVLFKDVAGQEEAKESLQEVVDFLHNPGKYTQIGAKLPKGALLVGPPGTGKTLLAKAVAGEAKVPFFSLSGSEFVEMFVGVGASRVRDLFEEAKKNAPCIVFIDEIDAIGKSRDSRYGGGNDEREQTLNQLLAEMDGFDTSRVRDLFEEAKKNAPCIVFIDEIDAIGKSRDSRYGGGNDEREQTLNQLLAEMDGFDTSKGLLILAATNRPEVLDPALLRPGRFDRRIIVDRPDLKGRVEILKVHAKNVMLDETVDLDAIALATSGAVGSDLANMINEAAILAVKNGRRAVSQKDLQESVEVVLVGKEKKDRILSVQERRIVSYHEVGHALVNALQKDAEPVQKITIVPRTMGALGYVMQVPEEEKYLNTQKELEAMLVGYLGGRAAEEIVFDTVTTGAANDIEQATKVARAMITQYGMSQKFGLMGLATQENQYLSGRAVLNCGDDTATEIDHEVMQLLHYSYEEAKRLLNEHREALDKIAEYLIRRETITGKEFMKIFRAVERGLEIPENLDELPDFDKKDEEKQPETEVDTPAKVNLSKEALAETEAEVSENQETSETPAEIPSQETESETSEGSSTEA